MSTTSDPLLSPEIDRLLRDLGQHAGAQPIQVIRQELERCKRAELSARAEAEQQRQALAEAEEGRQTLRQKEAALRESEERFSGVCDNAQAAVGILVGSRLVYANRYFSELTGYSVEEILSMDFRQMAHPSFHQLMADRARKRLAGEPVPNHYEFLAITKSGEERWIDFSPATTVLNGKPVIIGTGFDVTERKRAGAELEAAKASAEQAKAIAEEANRAKDHFLAVLSHELRTPLTPVVAAISMLLKQWQCDQSIRETLEMILRNVEMEARLIDDLLDVTRITRGKVGLDRRPVLLCEVIRSAVEVCKPDIEARGLTFVMEVDPIAPCLIYADAARLQQVFWNLLKNAIKFTPHGGCVGIRCRLDGQGVLAEVTDSGEGIDPAMLPHIFNPFEQGGTGTTRQFGGLGLGLTITRGLVEMHGGSISAHSEGKGKGATFRVRLPIHIASESPLPSGEGKDITAGWDGSAVSVETRSLRILLVEDHSDTARIMRRLLTSEGHEVEAAGNVTTALELAGARPFDLLISDLGLPDGSGVDLMRELRHRGNSVLGIALSGYGQEEDIHRSKEAGFAEHLTKPTSPHRLVNTIATVTGSAPRVIPDGR